MNTADLQVWRLGLHAAIDALFDALERGAREAAGHQASEPRPGLSIEMLCTALHVAAEEGCDSLQQDLAPPPPPPPAPPAPTVWPEPASGKKKRTGKT